MEPDLSGRGRKRSAVASIGVLLLVSIAIVARQFTHYNFASCVIDDSILHMSWVRQFTEILMEGVWLPRWLPDSNGGYGSPTFIFYSPLVYYVSALCQWMTGSVVLAMKLVRWVGLFLSSLTMFVYASSLVSRKLALAVALACLVLPFHVLDVSYWTLYAEPWAWVWLPLILLCLRRSLTCKANRRFSLTAFSLCYAGLILTHLVSAFMYSFIIASYWLFHRAERKFLEGAKRTVAGVAGGLALAAFFLFPVLWERKFVHIEYSILLPEYHFENTFLFFPNDELTRMNPFQGKTIRMLQVLTFLQFVWLILGAVLVLGRRREDRYLHRELWLWVVWSFICLFLMSRLSTWIWKLVPGLPQIQFSTRWLSVLSMATALVSGTAFGAYGSSGGRWLKLAHFGLGLVLGLLSVLIISHGCFLEDQHLHSAQANIMNAPEYNPHAMPNWKERVIYPADPQFQIKEGAGQVTVERWAAQSRRLTVEASTPIRLKLRLYQYPGWAASVDNQEIPIGTDPASGGMLLDIPPGRHSVEVNFGYTWWRKLSMAVSVLSVVMLAAFGYRELKRGRGSAR